MCGVNGIFAYHYAANPVDRGELVRTREHMATRGPDGAGEWISADGRVGLGHRRLAIIDLSEAGAQPMASADGRLVLSFNGEIYNHEDLRRSLEAKGHVFRSRSDSEVLLHLYAEKGEAMVHDLRGMFAFAIWDGLRNRLVLARDPLGIKPLYYADDGWTFRFASQVKALLAGGALSREPEPAGQVGFFLFGSVPEPFTTVRAVRALPAGAILTVDRVGAHGPQRYHSIAETFARASTGAAGDRGAPAELAAMLRESVRVHLVADVEVGAFLSAGVDSGALVGLMRDAGQADIRTVTLAFAEFRGQADDEGALAESVARRYGTRHTTRLVTRPEFEADLPAIFERMDQPSIDGINTWFVSKAAAECGLKVALSGLGGDELFGGYPSFRDLPLATRWLTPARAVPGLGATLRRVAQPVVGRLGLHPKTAGLVELGCTWSGAFLLRRGLFMPWELSTLMEPETVRVGMSRLRPLERVGAELAPWPGSPFACVSTLESAIYMRNQLLRDTDWASMAHSVEVRVPLVDATLLAGLAGWGDATRVRDGKRMLAQAPTNPLPPEIVRRRKTGFSTPVAEWTRQGHEKGPDASHAARTWARHWARSVAGHFGFPLRPLARREPAGTVEELGALS